MSNSLVVGVLMDAIITAINAAWDNPTIGEDSIPRTIQDLPFVSLSWLEVHIDMGGYSAAVTSPNQAYRFEIIYFFPMPPADGTHKLSRVKAQYASDIIAQLQTGPTFAGIAIMPIVERISAKDRSPAFEGAAEVRVQFSCQVQASYL